MALIKFETQKGATSIRAADLDRNFEQLQPVNNGTYGINQDAGGWSLDIFPPFPETATQMLSLVYHNGGLQWRTLPDLLAELTDEEKLTFINALLASIDSGNGGIGLREVERCDGKRMMVLGTDWYDPE